LTLRQLKVGYFVLEGLNAFATSFFFYYLFFFMQRQYGFGNLGNLALAALNGFIYMFMARVGGRFGQEAGYFRALRVGFATMILAMVLGAFSKSWPAQVCALAVWSFGICFTWPTLEALASEKEDSLGLQQMVGIYNLVWAGCSALAYFIGGLVIEQLGPLSLFWIPCLLHLVQLTVLGWLSRQSEESVPAPPQAGAVGRIPLNPRPIARAKAFLRMAWWANPFAYVGINTVAAIVPGLAHKLDLSPMQAGFFCSVWFFARVATFLTLWLWTGWHYRLRWFLGAYLLLIGSFAAILLVPKLGVIVLAQVAFGLAVGLIYYSSLYYSMAVGETKGEHGGLHESAIGAGIFAGPALGATALGILPDYPNSSAWAVSVALLGGLLGLLLMIARQRTALAVARP
jgi:predicted MFS family arabinose efflux permease